MVWDWIHSFYHFGYNLRLSKWVLKFLFLLEVTHSSDTHPSLLLLLSCIIIHWMLLIWDWRWRFTLEPVMLCLSLLNAIGILVTWGWSLGNAIVLKIHYLCWYLNPSHFLRLFVKSWRALSNDTCWDFRDNVLVDYFEVLNDLFDRLRDTVLVACFHLVR